MFLDEGIANELFFEEVVGVDGGLGKDGETLVGTAEVVTVLAGLLTLSGVGVCLLGHESDASSVDSW
jgi:hypothetical protein